MSVEMFQFTYFLEADESDNKKLYTRYYVFIS